MLQLDVPVPVLLATLSVPSEIAPSKNSTLPVGAALPLEAVTIAVNVTALPYVDVLALDETVVVVEVEAGALTTTSKDHPDPSLMVPALSRAVALK